MCVLIVYNTTTTAAAVTDVTAVFVAFVVHTVDIDAVAGGGAEIGADVTVTFLDGDATDPGAGDPGATAAQAATGVDTNFNDGDVSISAASIGAATTVDTGHVADAGHVADSANVVCITHIVDIVLIAATCCCLLLFLMLLHHCYCYYYCCCHCYSCC